MEQVTVGSLQIRVVLGSVLDQEVDAVVNAANKAMRGGGGIDGATHARAGRGLMEELMKIAPNGCRTGQVVVTTGQKLPQKFIIHAAGPWYQNGKSGEAEKLASCYANALKAAADRSLSSIAFCSISTGIYGYPLNEAATIAIRATFDFAEQNPETTLRELIFAMFKESEFAAFTQALAARSTE